MNDRRHAMLAKFTAGIAAKAQRAATALTTHRMLYGYTPRYDVGPDGEVRILECSIPFGECPPRYQPTCDNLIARVLQEAREGRDP